MESDRSTELMPIIARVAPALQVPPLCRRVWSPHRLGVDQHAVQTEDLGGGRRHETVRTLCVANNPGRW
jgi:hypothetical protein